MSQLETPVLRCPCVSVEAVTAGLTTQEAAARLGLQVNRVQRAASDGRLAASRVGGTWRVLLDESGRMVYRAARVAPEWRGRADVVVLEAADEWPAEVAARMAPPAPDPQTDALQRRVQELERDLEFQRMASRSLEEDHRAQLARERRVNQLQMRELLLSMANAIPPADERERRELGLPSVPGS